MSREAMTLALDALERYEYAEAREALRAALEPVQPSSPLTDEEIDAALESVRRIDNCVDMTEFARAIERRVAAPPEGYVMVPVDANDAILQAAVSVLGGGHVNTDVVRDVYKAMLSAARGE